jgi:hypothetical protein
MEVTTDNIIELIEDYTGTEQVQLNQITKKNGDDYQVWDRSNLELKFPLTLIPNLSFDYDDEVMFYYTSKGDEKVVGLNTIYIKELLWYNLKPEKFIKEWKLPKLETYLEKYVDEEKYDYAIQNRDFINHLKNKIK